MPKLTESVSTQGVGREAIFALINEMNASRASKGIRQRYRPVVSGGELTMVFDLLPSHLDSNAPSPEYWQNDRALGHE